MSSAFVLLGGQARTGKRCQTASAADMAVKAQFLGSPDSLPLIEMRNVRLHSTEHATLIVNELRGRMINLREYNRQLVAGYSKNLPGLGLVTYFPDYSTLK